MMDIILEWSLGGLTAYGIPALLLLCYRNDAVIPVLHMIVVGILFDYAWHFLRGGHMARRRKSATMLWGVNPACVSRVENFSRSSTSSNSASSVALLHNSKTCLRAPSSRRRGGPPGEMIPDTSVFVSSTTRTIRRAG